MNRVDFKFTNGQRRMMAKVVADLLQRRGLGTYETRDMGHLPRIEKAQDSAPVAVDLDTLDRDQLHALAKERGVKVHHAAGADKVRAALRGD